MHVNLMQYRTNYHSQGGEDGIIEKILAEAGLVDGYFVEFGAWDGVFLSNTCRLAERGWGGIFIEADPARFEDLRRNHGARDIELVNALVMPIGENSLSNIIGRTRFAGRDPTVLSIDIDSDDLATWQGFEQRAFLVVIEYNPTIPADVSFTNPAGMQVGNSALAIYEYAAGKGYALVAQTDTNMIFMDRERLPATIPEVDFLQAQQATGQRYFFGYDGTLYRWSRTEAGRPQVRADEVFPTPWANAPFMQPVPAFFRSRWRGSRSYYTLMFIVNTLMLLTRPVTMTGFATNNWRKAVRFTGGVFGRASDAEDRNTADLDADSNR